MDDVFDGRTFALMTLDTGHRREVEALNDAKSALAQQQAAAEGLYLRLKEADHMRFDHGAAAAQEAIRSLNRYRDLFDAEVVKALDLVTVGNDPGDVFVALKAALSPHITSALSRLREIESANGQAGWCRHQKKPAAANGWTADREGSVVRLRLVTP